MNYKMIPLITLILSIAGIGQLKGQHSLRAPYDSHAIARKTVQHRTKNLSAETHRKENGQNTISNCAPCDWITKSQIIVTGKNPYKFKVGGIPEHLESTYGYYWDFGDKSYSTKKTIEHKFNMFQKKTVFLTIYYYDELRENCCSTKISVKLA